MGPLEVNHRVSGFTGRNMVIKVGPLAGNHGKWVHWRLTMVNAGSTVKYNGKWFHWRLTMVSVVTVPFPAPSLFSHTLSILPLRLIFFSFPSFLLFL